MICIKIEKTNDLKIQKNWTVSVKDMGNISEVVFQDRVNRKIKIRKLSGNHYLNLETGEILESKHIKSRIENANSVRKSLRKLRDYINFNVTDIDKVKWITLTYAENMTDTKRLYKDFEKFIKRFRYHFSNYHIEYIVAMEPQARGAWHCHLLFIFNEKPGFISNALLSSLWQHGFTKIKDLNGIDNIGAYLSAYLSDLDTEEYNQLNDKETEDIIYYHLQGIKQQNDKRYIKGGRLYMYPKQFNLYRCSKGIKKPLKKYMLYGTFKEERKKIGLSPKPISSKTINIKLLDSQKPIIIAREVYNNFIS